jgi:alanyl-tRNA synthetase
MLEQRNRARNARKNAGAEAWEGSKNVADFVEATVFTGYEKLEDEAKIVAIVASGALVEELNAASKSALALPRSIVVDDEFCTISNVQAIEAEVVEAAPAATAQTVEAKEFSFPILYF